MQNLNKKSETQKILKKLYHLDLKSFLVKSFETLHPNQKFIDNWHLDLILEHLRAVEKKQIKRLLINMPPRALKSFCISVAWPAWILGNNPNKKIIVASYSQALSNKHSLDSKCIAETEWFQQYFPKFKIKHGQNQKHKFSTGEHGFRFATSVGSTLTGEGADIIIIDDPVSSLKAMSRPERLKCINWYEQTLSSRLNDKKNGAIILVMQRLHPEDLSGYLLKKNIFKHLKLQAVAEKNEEIKFNGFYRLRKEGEILNENIDNAETLNMYKQEMGAYAYEAQYQQNPLTTNSGIIKPNWISRYDSAEGIEEIYQSWDTAIKNGESNDYSVCTTWGLKENNFYLLDVFRDKLNYPELKKSILQQQQKHNAIGIIIEDKASGQQLIQELLSSPLNIIKFTPKYDKVTRLVLTSILFEAGKVYFPSYRGWLEGLEEELFCFPNVKNDDRVDSITQFLLWVRNKKELEMSLRRV
ncbi:phage terminase large subunit [Candidatus Jidaibacter acanthamoebae]|nr:phage terminase large subunit [Candidatus Jidaibacter acanthamoeba]